MAAASTALHPVLTGPVRPGTVLGVLPGAVHVLLDGVPPEGGGVLAVLSPRAARLPIGVVPPASAWSADRRLGPEVAPGAPALIGDGAVRIAGLSWRVSRWWDPRVPRLGVPVPAAISVLIGRLPAPPAALAGPTARLAEALGTPAMAGLDAAVSGLVGLGPGLTPAGDDVLTGCLVALRAFGADALQGRLALSAVRRMPATTLLSKALLARAGEGEGVPELIGLLRACTGSDPDRVATAVAGLARVGHSSGTAMGHGALVGIRAAVSARAVAA